MRYFTLLACSLLLTLNVGCKEEPKETAQVVRPIKFEKVGLMGGGKKRTFSGTARTNKIINLSFRGQGILTELNIKIGQQVKKGELLGRLDNVQNRLNYETAIATLTSNTSEMNTAKLNLDRNRILYEKGSASLSDFETAKNSFTTAQSGYESAKRTVAIQKDQINYGYLYAPEDGTISAVNVEVDENIGSGKVVGVLNSGVRMEIALGLPESVINQVSEGMKASVSFSTLGDTSFTGTVTELSPAVDANTATYPSRITIDNPADEIKSGMAANVTFNLGAEADHKPLPLVPAQAVGEDSNGNFVFLVNQEGDKATVSKHPVTVGELTSEGFAITQGLSEGQLIATAGLQTLLDGQQVSLDQ